MLLLSKAMIQQFFSLQDGIDAVKDAFALFSKGKVQVPLRTRIVTEGGDGTFLCMPSYCAEEKTACVKALNMFPANIQKGIPSIHAQILIMDTETGVIEGLLDGSYVTQLRTGAASGAALDILAKKECKKGALIGTGGQARTQLEAMLIARNLDEIQISDLIYERAQAFMQQMTAELGHYGTRLTAVSNADHAVRDADVIITVTISVKPVFDGKNVKPGATVCGVGSYQPHMQELPPSLLAKAAKIYFDSQEAVLSEAGDILIPLGEGIITEESFTGELGSVICGDVAGRESDEEIILFKTVGIAAQDLLTAKYIFERAKKSRCGLVWE